MAGLLSIQIPSSSFFTAKLRQRPLASDVRTRSLSARSSSPALCALTASRTSSSAPPALDNPALVHWILSGRESGRVLLTRLTGLPSIYRRFLPELLVLCFTRRCTMAKDLYYNDLVPSCRV